jgi:hypothetical protein
MSINRTTILATILLFTVFICETSVAYGQTVTAGVSKGETFDYSYSLLWTSTDPTATPPADLIEYNNTQTIQFHITDVSGTILTVDLISNFKNGTHSTQSGTINIQSGEVKIPYGFFIVGANILKGQRVYPTGGYQTITDTVMRSYTSGQRETNLMSGQDSSQKTTIYIDKIKGVTVDYVSETYETFGSTSTVTTETLLNTNPDVWIHVTPPPATPTPTPTSTPSSTPNSATNTPTNNPTSAVTTPPHTSPPNSATNRPITSQPTNPGYSVINGTIEPSNDILIIAVIAVVIGVVLVVVLLMVRKRGSRKQKTPKEGKAKKDKNAPAENDFDLSGFNLK